MPPPQMQPGNFPGAPPAYPPQQQQAPGGWGGAPQQQGPAAAQKTMIAGQQPGQFPGAPPQHQGGYGAPIPGQFPGAPPQMQQPQQPGAGYVAGPGGYHSATPVQKTMMVGLQAPQMGPGGGGMPPPGAPPPGAPQQQGAGGPAKTVMLRASDGIVSVAGKGPIAAVDEGPRGASAAFWIVSMIVGIGVGVLAYVIMLQM
jgi:hypothetical protein